MDATTGAKVPMSFWIIAVAGLLWNCLGVYLYMLARFDPDTALAGASPAMRDYVASQPVWANIGYGLGIWGSFLGSVLLLLRSRHAVTAFLVSLLGALVSYAGQGMAGVLDPGITIVVLVVIVFLWWFSRNEAAKGTLR